MVVYGLTGGIGSGKTAAGNILMQSGVPVIDTDLIARELTRPGSPELAKIAAEFGKEVLSNEGLNRQRLAEIVFASDRERKRLEEILHPPIRSAWRKEVSSLKEQGRAIAVVVIPLLFETGAEIELDRTICVACSAATQQKRLSGRGWSQEHINLRMAAQLSMQEKMDRADYVVWNEFDLGSCAEQLWKIVPP